MDFDIITLIKLAVESSFTKNILATFILVLILVFLRNISLKYIHQKEWANETLRLKIQAMCRQLYLALITLVVVAIWIPKIQAFAISIAAISVAIILSFKEVLMCFTGALVRSTGDILAIGERVDIGGIQGDVVKVGFLTTELLQVGSFGQRTGKIIRIPNSLFLTTTVINNAIVKGYFLHVMVFPISFNRYTPSLKDRLLEIVNQAASDYLLQAKEAFQRFAKQAVFTDFNVNPRVLVQLDTPSEVKLIVRFPIPVVDKIKIEQEITQQFLALMRQEI